MKVEWIIWDWNGTLADDAPVFCDILNRMLSARELPALTFEQYRRIYDHPVILIYERAGFDVAGENFDLIAAEFCRIYEDASAGVELQHDARYALDCFEEAGIRQVLLSALPEQLLLQAVKQHGIAQYFSALAGLADSYGRSKLELGRRLIEKLEINTQRAVMIGDSLHDGEVARELGVQCCLVGRGLQHPERLVEHGSPVYASLTEVIERICPAAMPVSA